MNTLKILTAVLFMLVVHESPASSQEIFGAVMSGDLNRTKMLIEEHPEWINATSWGEWTPLHRASQHGHRDIAEFLLLEGANLEARTSLRMTPLYVAIYSQKRDMVQLLVDKGADINALRSDGETMLHIAAAVGDEGIVDLLISKGLDVNVNRRYGITPLHLASVFGHKTALETLISNGADINAKNDNGSTSLHLAAAAGEAQIVELLVASGAENKSEEYIELTGDYLDQKKPGSTPELFEPGILFNTHRPHGGFTISPDGNSIYWAAALTFGTYQRIWMMSREGDRWSPPVVAPQFDEYTYGKPAIVPDGKVLFVESNRPTGGDGKPSDYNIWLFEKASAGWGDLTNPGPPLNSDKNEFGPSVSGNGTVYFYSSKTDGGYGASDIYRSEFANGRYGKPENLGDSVNSSSMDVAPYIAPDESYLLFSSFRDGGYGDFDLYISFRMKDGSWTKAKNLGDSVNTPAMESLAVITPDGRFMFFTSRRNGIGELFWVNAKVIEEVRQRELK